MAPPLTLAERRARHVQALARAASQRLGGLWAGVDRSAIAASWSAAVGPAVAVMAVAQQAAADGSDAYLDALVDGYGLPADAVGTVSAASLAGVASDGRELASLLYRPAITALTAIGRGVSPAGAMAAGRFSLDMISRTQVADAARVADGVALTARPQLTGYVRMLSLPSCSRCAILAGRFYRWNAGFQRHPRCDCRHIPAPESMAGDLTTDPHIYFESLSIEDQDRIFTQAGAQAVRDGADMARVVNARSGMYTASGHTYTYTMAGRRPRLMPESIYQEAHGNRKEALRLLRLHGFLR